MRPTDVPDTGEWTESTVNDAYAQACATDAPIMTMSCTFQAYCAICCGQILTRTSPDGPRTIVVSPSHSDQTWCLASCKNTTWT